MLACVGPFVQYLIRPLYSPSSILYPRPPPPTTSQVLSRLTIRNINAFTSDDFQVLGSLRRLRYLKLGGCRGVTDVTIEKGICHLKELALLDIARSRITDYGAKLLAMHLPLLESVNLYGCEHITTEYVLERRKTWAI